MQILQTHDGLKAVLELDQAEIEWWRKKIGVARKKIIPSPSDSVNLFFADQIDAHGLVIDPKNASEFIAKVRKGVWTVFVQHEIDFFSEIIGVLINERDVPREILEALMTDETIEKLANSKDKDSLLEIVADIFQDYSGRIFPYFYELSKSQTNSRRSRAGSEFEAIIDQLMTRMKIPYDSQSHLGQRTFSEKGLGKKVDGVVPSMEAFNENRSRCIITTMKTTIRERWQEVVEELNRTNIPSIHLLTLDESITENVLTLMKNHNITLVTYKHIKVKHPKFTNIMDFETFFTSEIPHTLDWWQKNKAIN